MPVPAISTSTASAVNSPASANSLPSQSVKSVALGAGSEIDNGGLRDIILKQAPEGSAALFEITRFELREGAEHINLGRFRCFGRNAGEHRLGYRHEIGCRLQPGFTVAGPPKGPAQARQRR